MTKEEFIFFIKELGFTKTWTTDKNRYSLATDVIGNSNQNAMVFTDQLKTSMDDERVVQLSLSQMSTHMISGKNFGNFQLSTFGNDGDFQLEIFLSFIKGAFKNPPKNIIQYMRDKKIRDILK
jgi:uncharacterized protein